VATKKKVKGEGKTKKGAIPQDLVDKILRMKPEKLTVAAFFEGSRLQASKDQLAKDHKVADFKALIEKFKAELENDPAVVIAQEKVEEAKEALAKAKLDHMDPDHIQAQEDLKLYKKGWQQEIRDRAKVHKFMIKTLDRHKESGALKPED